MPMRFVTVLITAQVQPSTYRQGSTDVLVRRRCHRGLRNTEPASGLRTPKIYSDTATHCALVLKSVFHLSLRATEGFLPSLMELIHSVLPYRTGPH